MSYEWRSLDGVDTTAWSELVRLIADEDQTAEYYSAEDLAEELEDDDVVLGEDTIAVYDGGELVAFGQVRVRAGAVDGHARTILMGGVHPEHRGRGIGRELMDRLEEAGIARAASIHPDITAQLSAEAGSKAASHLALLAHRGYLPVRYYHHMIRYAQPGDADLPTDPRVRPYDPALDTVVRDTHTEAFASHWAFSPPSDGEWHQWFTGSRTFRPEHSVVMSLHGTGVDGIVLAYQYEPQELWIGQIGVVPAARRQGIAQAGLLAVIAAAARAGYSEVGLGVDTANADGAGALYSDAGFGSDRTSIVHQLPVA